MFIQDLAPRLKTASAGAFAHPALLFRFAAVALVGPFILFTVGGRESNNIPWSFWTTILLMLFLVISIGFLRFTRESHEGYLDQPGPQLTT